MSPRIVVFLLMINLLWSDSFHLYFQYWHIFQWCYICQQWSVFKRDQHLSVMLALKFWTMMIWNLISIIWSLRLKCGWRVNNCNIGLWIPAVKLHKLWLKSFSLHDHFTPFPLRIKFALNVNLIFVLTLAWDGFMSF